MRDADWQPAWLLHARPYRETSVLAEWLLPAQGRVGAILRGARRAGQGVPAPFQPFFLRLGGQSELKRVIGHEPAGPAQTLIGMTLFSGLYLNELLVRLLPRELPQPELFIAYAGAVGELAALQGQEARAVEVILRRFERQLLEAMGQAIVHTHQADTQAPLQPATHYQYYPEQGWLPARAGQQGACLGADILAVGADDFSTPARRRLAKQLYRFALEPLLAGRPLKSRELFAALVPTGSALSPPAIIHPAEGALT